MIGCLATGTAGGGAVEGQRLPVQYQPLQGTEDDDDIAAGVLPEVAGGVDATAMQIARLAAGAGRGAAREAAGEGQQEQQEQQLDEAEYLPPANGAEDVYTLLKMYNISAPLVSGATVLQGRVGCVGGEGLGAFTLPSPPGLSGSNNLPTDSKSWTHKRPVEPVFSRARWTGVALACCMVAHSRELL